MKYLKCIELLNFLQSKISSETRKQITTRDAQTVRTGLITITQTLDSDDQLPPEVVDLINSIDVIEKSGVEYLTNGMKGVIVEGLNNIKNAIGIKAYNYYCTNDFEPTDQIIPLMREVVTIALNAGVLKI